MESNETFYSRFVFTLFWCDFHIIISGFFEFIFSVFEKQILLSNRNPIYGHSSGFQWVQWTRIGQFYEKRIEFKLEKFRKWPINPLVVIFYDVLVNYCECISIQVEFLEHSVVCFSCFTQKWYSQNSRTTFKI